MSSALEDFKLQYLAALDDFSNGKGETALRQAYELGRKAIEDSLGILNIVNIHKEKALEDIKTATSSLEFLTECLSPFEMTQRAFKESIETLKKLAEQAKQASRAKSEFIANMSHELRTPLNSILGFAQVLEAEYYGKLASKQKEYIGDILEAGQYLLSLINDILDLAKIESGRMELNLSQVDLKMLLNNALILLKEKAEEQSIRYGLEMHTQIPDEILGDERKIKQVLFNLLSNAFKYTPGGGEVSIEVKKNEEGWLEIAVLDSGSGINEENQKKLFLPFVQLDNSKPGSGLGLHLCKKMVDLWGGKIGVISPPQERESGCQFYFTIPLQEASNE